MTNHDAKLAAPETALTTDARSLRPPVAERKPVEHVIHGDSRIDNYGWLREKSDPAVLAYLREENAYTSAVLQPTEAFQENLYQEMLGRILQTDLSVPYRLRGYDYFTRTEEGKQYPVYARRRINEVEEVKEAKDNTAPEEVLLDLNVL